MKILRLNDDYSFIDPAWWLSHMTPAGKGLQGCDELLADLRFNAPEGCSESHQNMPVILMPGKEIDTHQHPEWTLIYFIDAEDTPLQIEHIIIEPANNTAILIEPYTPHRVWRNETKRPRLSLALRFSETR